MKIFSRLVGIVMVMFFLTSCYVGQGVSLQFKEEGGELTPEKREEIWQDARDALSRIEGGADFSKVGEERHEVVDYVFESDIPESLREVVVSLNTGEYFSEPVEVGGTYFIDERGRAVEEKSVVLVKLSDVMDEKYKYETISYSLIPDSWVDTALNENYLSSAEVMLDSYDQPYVSIVFDDEGSRLFEEITERNVGRQIGIFVNGELISTPVVHEKISGGEATIVGQFTIEEAKALVEGLNGAIGVGD